MASTDIALAAAIHDPDGRFQPAVERLAPALREMFSHFAFNISEATAPDLINAVRTCLGADVIFHHPDENGIGRFRRDAVRLALPADAVLYTDIDHLLRWIEFKPDDLYDTLTNRSDADVLVIGRSPRAFAAEPRRLQETERLINHIYALIAGNTWDLLFAIRRMSRRAAELIVAESRVDTLANDVEWPLLARNAGFAVAYAESDALFYRSTEEFGASADTGDDDPLQWIRRVEFAALMASTMRSFLK